jgi:hypothetical protein
MSQGYSKIDPILYTTRVDEASATVTYIGYAEIGSSQA